MTYIEKLKESCLQTLDLLTNFDITSAVEEIGDDFEYNGSLLGKTVDKASLQLTLLARMLEHQIDPISGDVSEMLPESQRKAIRIQILQLHEDVLGDIEGQAKYLANILGSFRMDDEE